MSWITNYLTGRPPFVRLGSVFVWCGGWMCRNSTGTIVLTSNTTLSHVTCAGRWRTSLWSELNRTTWGWTLTRADGRWSTTGRRGGLHRLRLEDYKYQGVVIGCRLDWKSNAEDEKAPFPEEAEICGTRCHRSSNSLLLPVACLLGQQLHQSQGQQSSGRLALIGRPERVVIHHGQWWAASLSHTVQLCYLMDRYWKPFLSWYVKSGDKPYVCFCVLSPPHYCLFAQYSW